MFGKRKEQWIDEQLRKVEESWRRRAQAAGISGDETEAGRLRDAADRIATWPDSLQRNRKAALYRWYGSPDGGQ